MLLIVGLGLFGFGGISLRGLEAAKGAEKVFLEAYTSPTEIDIEELQRILGREVSVLKREDIEERDIVLREAEESDVALLCPGDPLIATTHISLIIEARKRDIETRIFHAASIYTAAMGESGLHIYKFGRTATLPITGDFLPFSVYDCLAENVERGLHTILLLEHDVERGEFLSVRDALGMLLRMEGEKKKGIVKEDQTVIVLSGLESGKDIKVAATIRELARMEFPPLPTALIVPGKIHFMEREALDMIRGGV